MSTNPKKKISREWFEITITEHYKWLANNTKGKQAYVPSSPVKYAEINLPSFTIRVDKLISYS